MKRIDIDNLNNLTTQLLDELKILPQIYENNEEPSKDKTFFQYVRNETKVLFDMLDEWEKLAEDFVLQRRSGVHLHQIQATKNNMQTLILHSYYKDVRKRRYMEIYKSCKFIFQQVLKELSNEGSTD